MKKLIEIKFGSHLYGTNTENSDLDMKAIYLPEAKDILLGRYKKTISTSRPKRVNERNTKDDIDIEVFSLDRFLQLLMEGQTVALDMIFAPDENVTYKDPDYGFIWDRIKTNKLEFLTKNVKAFISYARNQAAKYGIKGSRIAALRKILDGLQSLPQYDKLLDHDESIVATVDANKSLVSLEKTPLLDFTTINNPKGVPEKHLVVCNRKIPYHAKVKYAVEVCQKILDEYGKRALQAETDQGVDWKALSHSVRVNEEAIELLTTGHITFPCPKKDLLLQIKKGELHYKDVATMIEEGLAAVTEIHKTSSLRETPNQELADGIVASAYGVIVDEWINP